MQQDKDLPKGYEPRQVEDRTYASWMQKGYFSPKIDKKRKPFSIVMPPPNVTGELHLGHALTATLEDIMVRWHRMKGEVVLWLPGVDHAGIATQVVIERQLAAEGLTRYDLGRDKFVARAWAWAKTCRETVRTQHQKLGASCDWTREIFTLDEGPSRAVAVTFVNLYNKGLIYQGERIINWCPRCRTALSDLETEHRETAGSLYYIKYPVVDDTGHLTVATTRPETMFGDTAVAVNPHDPRYREMIGRKVAIPVIRRPIPVIADEAVEYSFGTGALKVTPAHDPVDFDIAQRHGLPSVNILHPDATLNQEAGPYQGFDRFQARRDLLRQLEREGLLVKVESHQQSVGHCARCGTVVEPWASKQWFVRTQPLAEPAIRAVREGHITIIPEQFTRVYLHWMENIRDWCISRQLWWGHRIPVWHCGACGGKTVVAEAPAKCAHCGSQRIAQDPDVLDTWFSSALWPHSTLGWPEETEDFGYFYPTTVLETGYDILFFWVARMIMMGLENTGRIPFRYVYLHGLIRDEQGEKMSKIKGNVINPLTAIEDYGADALRFAVTTGTAPGNDVQVSPQKLEAARNFANKLWNAARFVIRSLPPVPVDMAPGPDLTVEDRWILSRLDRLVAGADRLLHDFQFGETETRIHDFLWGDFCDWYIEMAKIRLREGGSPSPVPVLVFVLETSLRLLHPFMPFITEEIWGRLVACLQPHRAADSLILAAYPVPTGYSDERAEAEMQSVIEIVRSIRNARAQLKAPANSWTEAWIHSENKEALEIHRQSIENLARSRPLRISEPPARDAGRPAGAMVLVLKDAEVVLPAPVDLQAERERLEKQKSDLQARIATLQARLADAAFLQKAPSQVVQKERDKLADSQGQLKKLEETLARTGKG
jgi:valyl-tRNA synthetase